MQADGQCGCAVHKLQIQRFIHGKHASTQARVDLGRTIGDPIHISALQCGEPGIETGRCHGNAMNDDVRRQHGLESASQRLGDRNGHVPYAAIQYLIGYIQMRHLVGGVHTGVGAPSHRQTQRFGRIIGRHPQHLVQRIFNGALHRTQIGLFGPAIESAAVVGQVNAQSCHSHSL